MNILFKALNSCCYINRLIRDGLHSNFNLQNVNPNDKAEVKTFAEAECQVEEDELEKPEVDGSDNSIPEILEILKDHAIGVVTRLKPSKRGY